MKTKNSKKIKKRLSVWALVVVVILTIPLLARAPWTLGDFVFVGVVLFGLATGYELITKNMRNDMHRAAVGFAAVVVLLLIWAWAVA